MKISLKLANGASLEFEGDASDFERISEFLAEPPDSLTAEPSSPSAVQPPILPTTSDGKEGAARAAPSNVVPRLSSKQLSVSGKDARNIAEQAEARRLEDAQPTRRAEG